MLWEALFEKGINGIVADEDVLKSAIAYLVSAF